MVVTVRNTIKNSLVFLDDEGFIAMMMPLMIFLMLEIFSSLKVVFSIGK